jgi:hypothetical protein
VRSQGVNYGRLSCEGDDSFYFKDGWQLINYEERTDKFTQIKQHAPNYHKWNSKYQQHTLIESDLGYLLTVKPDAGHAGSPRLGGRIRTVFEMNHFKFQINLKSTLSKYE